MCFCKSDPDHLWECFEIQLQMGFQWRLSVWMLRLLESDFSLFLFNKTHRRHQIQSIGNAEQNPCCYQQHVIEANMKSSSPSTEAEQVGCCTPAWQRNCFVLCLCLMKLHHQHVVTNTYRVTAATHADRLLTSVHTSSIWSHITVERKSCRCICEGKKDLIYLSCEQTLRCLPHCLTHLCVTDSMLNCCGSHACAGPHHWVYC